MYPKYLRKCIDQLIFVAQNHLDPLIGSQKER